MAAQDLQVGLEPARDAKGEHQTPREAGNETDQEASPAQVRDQVSLHRDDAEETGTGHDLEQDRVAPAHALLRIPTGSAYASLNLAMAVQVVAYEIFRARAEGGFPFNPPPDPCKASDECHGPGTQAAPDPVINTITGPGNLKPPAKSKKPKCKSGFVKKNGDCVKKKKKNHRKSQRHTTRSHG